MEAGPMQELIGSIAEKLNIPSQMIHDGQLYIGQLALKKELIGFKWAIH